MRVFWLGTWIRRWFFYREELRRAQRKNEALRRQIRHLEALPTKGVNETVDQLRRGLLSMQGKVAEQRRLLGEAHVKIEHLKGVIDRIKRDRDDLRSQWSQTRSEWWAPPPQGSEEEP